MSRGVDSTEKNSDFPKEVSSPQSHLWFISMSMIPPSPKTKVFFEPIIPLPIFLVYWLKGGKTSSSWPSGKATQIACLTRCINYSTLDIVWLLKGFQYTGIVKLGFLYTGEEAMIINYEWWVNKILIK